MYLKSILELHTTKQSLSMADISYTSWTLLVAIHFCQFAKSHSVHDISNEVWFVVHHKENLQCHILLENELPYNRHVHTLKDERIQLTRRQSKKMCQGKFQRVSG